MKMLLPTNPARQLTFHGLVASGFSQTSSLGRRTTVVQKIAMANDIVPSKHESRNHGWKEKAGPQKKHEGNFCLRHDESVRQPMRQANEADPKCGSEPLFGVVDQTGGAQGGQLCHHVMCTRGDLVVGGGLSNRGRGCSRLARRVVLLLPLSAALAKLTVVR